MKRPLLAFLGVLFVLLVGFATSPPVGNAATLQLTGGSLMTFTARACQSAAITISATDFLGQGNSPEAVAVEFGSLDDACVGRWFELTIVLPKKEDVIVVGVLTANSKGRYVFPVGKFNSSKDIRIGLLTIDGWSIPGTWSTP